MLVVQGEQDSSKHELEEPGVQGKPKKDRSPATPIFVPIVVAMDQKDHKVMVEEWYSRQMVCNFLRMLDAIALQVLVNGMTVYLECCFARTCLSQHEQQQISSKANI